MKKRIENAVKTLGLEDEIIFSLTDLEKIAEMSEAPLIKVMEYLRKRDRRETTV